MYFRRFWVLRESVFSIIISLWRRANARNVSFFTLYGGQFMFSTQLLKLNYLLYSPTDAAPQFLLKLTPSFQSTQFPGSSLLLVLSQGRKRGKPFSPLIKNRFVISNTWAHIVLKYNFLITVLVSFPILPGSRKRNEEWRKRRKASVNRFF